MIELLTDVPDNVVAFEAVGEVSAEDYRKVLDPAVSAALANHEKISVVYVLADRFTGYTGPAMVEDAVVGTEHWRRWERLAVVTNTDWVRHAVHAFSWMLPGRIRIFPDSERAAALHWAESGD